MTLEAPVTFFKSLWELKGQQGPLRAPRRKRHSRFHLAVVLGDDGSLVFPVFVLHTRRRDGLGHDLETSGSNVCLALSAFVDSVLTPR